jgi:hypothetical protein
VPCISMFPFLVCSPHAGNVQRGREHFCVHVTLWPFFLRKTSSQHTKKGIARVASASRTLRPLMSHRIRRLPPDRARSGEGCLDVSGVMLPA